MDWPTWAYRHLHLCKLFHAPEDPVSVSEGSDPNALEVLVCHVYQHIHLDVLRAEDLVEVVQL